MTLEIGNYLLQSSELVKFLGVWIDNKLNWNKHINTLTAKLKQNLQLLRMSNKFLTKTTKKLIYYAHMYSHITYGILLWGNMINQNSIKKIQKIMNLGFTLITGLNPSPGNFKKERMLRLNDLIHLENNKLGYQLEKALLPCNLHDLLWTDSRNKTLQKTHQYNTRAKHLPKLPKAFNNRYYKGFQFQSIKDYELTPVHIREAPTLKTFIKRMKDHLFNTE